MVFTKVFFLPTSLFYFFFHLLFFFIIDRARSQFIEAQDEAQALEDSHPEWTDAPRWYAFRDSFDVKCANFQDKYDKVTFLLSFFVFFLFKTHFFFLFFSQVALKEESKKAIDDVKTLFSHASTYRRGSFGRALDYLVESRDAADRLRENDRLSRTEEVDDFLNDFDDEWQAMKDSFDEEVLVEDLEKAIDSALTPLSHASSYFKSGHQVYHCSYSSCFEL